MTSRSKILLGPMIAVALAGALAPARVALAHLDPTAATQVMKLL